MESVYERNLNIASASAQRHGFAAHVFWQPDPFRASRPPASDERGIASRYPFGFVNSVRTVMRQVDGKVSRFDDISDVLDSRSDSAHLDHAHVIPSANELIAGRIIEVLVSRRQL